MLYRINGTRPITRPTHLETWNIITNGPRKLTQAQFDFIIDGITRHMIDTHDKVTVPGWKAESNWAGLPWKELYRTAGKDTRLAAYMLGSMAQYAFIKHPAVWYCGQTVYTGRDIPNTYYFQKGSNE